MSRRQGKVTAASKNTKTDALRKNLTRKATGNKANEIKQHQIERAETKVVKKLPTTNDERVDKNVLPSLSDLLKRPCSPMPDNETKQTSPKPVKRFWIPLNNDDEEFVESIFKERKDSSLTTLTDSEVSYYTECNNGSNVRTNTNMPSDTVVANSITSDKNSTVVKDVCNTRSPVRFHKPRKAVSMNNEIDTEDERVLYFYTRSDPDEGIESRHLMARPDPLAKCRLYGFMPPSKRGLRVDTPCRKAGLSLRKNNDNIHDYALEEILLCDKKNEEANTTDDKYPSLKIILDVERLISGNRRLLEYKASLTQREQTCRVLEGKRKSLLKIIESREELLDRYREQLAGKEAKYQRLLFDNVETKAVIKKQHKEIERLLVIERQFYDQREELTALKEEHLNNEKSVITSCPITNNQSEESRPKMDMTSSNDVAVFSSRVTNIMLRLVNQSYGMIDQTCIEDVANQFECCVDIMEKLFKDNFYFKQQLGLEADCTSSEAGASLLSDTITQNTSKSLDSIPKLQESKQPEKTTPQKVANKTNLQARRIGAQSGRLRATNHSKETSATSARRWR